MTIIVPMCVCAGVRTHACVHVRVKEGERGGGGGGGERDSSIVFADDSVCMCDNSTWVVLYLDRYIVVCVSLCVCVYVYVCVCIFMCAFAHISTSVFQCSCVHLCVCVCVCDNSTWIVLQEQLHIQTHRVIVSSAVACTETSN